MKKNLIFILLIVGLIVTTIFTVVERINIEKEAKEIEVTLSYIDFEELAVQSENDIDSVFRRFSKLGVNSVALVEESFDSLIKAGYELELVVLEDLKKDTLWETRYPNTFVDYINNNEIDKSDAVVVSEDMELKSFILEGLALRYEETFFEVFEETGSNTYAILLDGISEDLLYSSYYKMYDETGKALQQKKDIIGTKLSFIGIGYSEEKVNNIKSGDLDVILRPLNFSRMTEKLTDAFIAELEKYNIAHRVMIFTGKEVLGYPDNHLDIYDFMEANNIVPALIETGVQRSNIEQKGLDEMVEYFDYQSVRVLPIIGYIQERYQHYNYSGGEEIENVIFRAVTERNIRMVYFRPYMYNDEQYVLDLDKYDESFERLSNRLEDHNMEFGKLSIMDFNDDSMIAAVLIGLGLISIVILAIRFFIKLPSIVEYITLVLGGLALVGALYVSPNLGRQLLALVSALVISSFGSLFLVEYAKEKYVDKHVFRLREVLIKAIIVTLSLSLLALFGGLIVGGLLSHSKYLLEIEFFRGVKASEMLPLLVFVTFYIIKFGYGRSREEIKSNEIIPKDIFRVLNLNIKLIYIVFASIAGGVLFVYIARSGHETTVQPSNIEMVFRNFLELKLLARPRLKEFLGAIPAMMLFVYISYKAYKPLICLVGLPALITFTSIINTFSHLRTPIYLSVIRTLFSIGFGIIIGIIVIVACDLMERLIHRIIRSKNNFEIQDTDKLI